MRQILFRWRGLSLYSYPTMLYLGIVFGIYAQLDAAKLIALDVGSTLTATLLLLTAALLGARLLFVVANWQIYRMNRARVFRCSDGGASMYGGVLLAVPLSFFILAALDIPFGAFWDTASFAMLIGMIVTRAGCFLNGCCAGRPISRWWGINLPNHQGVWRPRVPMQILEAGWGIAVLAAAALLWRRLSFDGAVFLFALGAYGGGRILLEPLREEQDRLMGVSVHKAVSAGFVVLSLCAFGLSWLHSH